MHKKIRLAAVSSILLFFIAIGIAAVVQPVCGYHASYAVQSIDYNFDTNGEYGTESDSWSQLFNERILPIITGTGLSILVLLVAVLRFLKTKGKHHKELTTAISDCKATERALNIAQQNLALLQKTLDEAKAEARELLQENKILQQAKDIKNFLRTTNDMQADIATLGAMMELSNAGHRSVWAGQPEALEALNAAPTRTVVKRMCAEIEAYKAKIVELKGAEALTEIANVEEIANESV